MVFKVSFRNNSNTNISNNIKIKEKIMLKLYGFLAFGFAASWITGVLITIIYSPIAFDKTMQSFMQSNINFWIQFQLNAWPAMLASIITGALLALWIIIRSRKMINQEERIFVASMLKVKA